MSAADSQDDVIQALKAQQQPVNGAEAEAPAATNGTANGNGVHHDHDDADDTDGGHASKSRKEEKEAIADLTEAVLADKAFSSGNEALAKKVEAAVCALDEAVAAAEEAQTKQKEAVEALEEAIHSQKEDPTPQLQEAASAVEKAAAKDAEAETALDEAVLVVGEAVIKNLDRAVTAVDEAVAPKPAPVVEVTPAPQQEEEEESEEELAPAAKEAPKEHAAVKPAEATPVVATPAVAAPVAAAPADNGPVDSSPAVKSAREWTMNRQYSEERRREVEEQSRPTLNKAALSTSIDEQSVRAAYEDVRSDTTDTEWAVFKFQDQRIVCSATGEGFDSFRGHFADNDRVFGFIRIQMGDEMSKRQKFVFLTWVGPAVSVIRRAKMSIDKAMVKNIVKNFAVELQVESQSEINVDYLRDQLARVGGANYGTGFRD